MLIYAAVYCESDLTEAQINAAVELHESYGGNGTCKKGTSPQSVSK